MDEEMRAMLTTIVNEIHNVKDELNEINEELRAAKVERQELKRKITSLELTLENETNRNIMVVAEGHLDLSRKLDESIKLCNNIYDKMEIQQLYINKHDSDIHKLIERIAKGIA